MLLHLRRTGPSLLKAGIVCGSKVLWRCGKIHE
jgi:hypothetical protein